MSGYATERVIDVTGRVLGELNNAPTVHKWIKDHPSEFEAIQLGYDELIELVNNVVPADNDVLSAMPRLRRLREILGDTPIPCLREMESSYPAGLKDAYGPMMLGQKIKTGEIEPTAEQKTAQIGTTSMDTTVEALAVGTTGHLVERTFFKWAEASGFTPEEGWSKDMLLQALDEAMMYRLLQGVTPPRLTNIFFRSNEDGGLGWLNQEKFDRFKADLSKIQQAG